MSARPERRRTLKVAALALVVLGVLALTLAPGASQVPIDTCGWCSADALADALRNLVLFVPLGAVLMWNDWRAIPAVVAAALLTIGIEASQFLVPGRQPSGYDVISNTAGALVGVVIVRSAALWWRPPRRRALLLAAAAAILATTLWLGAPALLRPALPHSLYFGQWAAQFDDYAWYGGHVTEASLAGMALPSQALDRSEDVRAALLAGEALQVRTVAGPAPSGVAPIFSIADGPHRFLLMIAADGDDLIVRYRTRAAELRLDHPAIRFRGALRDARPGAPLNLTVRLVDRGVCVTVNAAPSCRRFRGSSGWALLGYPVGIGSAATTTLNGVWSLLLAGPSCYWLWCARKRAR